MSVPDNLKQMVNHEIHRLEKKLNEAQSGIDSLKLILVEIKWVQEQDEVERT